MKVDTLNAVPAACGRLGVFWGGAEPSQGRWLRHGVTQGCQGMGTGKRRGLSAEHQGTGTAGGRLLSLPRVFSLHVKNEKRD